MKEFKAFLRRELQELYPDEEIQYFARIILSSVCKMDYIRQLLDADNRLDDFYRKQIDIIVGRLKQMEPLQYILGETEFYSLPLQVNPSVLIPRHETEELVSLIIKRHRGKALNIIDIGTGSGCIAIALKKHLPESSVTAMDISDGALQTAADNAKRNNVDIHFVKADILNLNQALGLFAGLYDLIVSNPPYIMVSEMSSMSANVLDFEPHTALFVPDGNPLMFYEPIAKFALQRLKKNGEIFLEMNCLCGDAMKKLLGSFGYQSEIIKDISGKDRFLRAYKDGINEVQ